jgi:holliday junction DNA helicase RuvA
MIARLRGRVLEAYPNRLVVDAGGVGYEVRVPLSSYDRLAPVVGSEVELRTHLVVGGMGGISFVLYGFATEEERDVFLLLIDRVSGIGPAIALAMLSGMAIDRFKASVVAGDAAALSQIKGVGKKTAERIVLELKDKVGLVDTWEQQAAGQVTAAAADAELALVALGYRQVEARKALRRVLDEQPGTGTEELIRAALRSMP